MSGRPDWLTAGAGRTPHLTWSVQTPAPLVALRLASETGELLAADAAGGLMTVDRSGRIVEQSRGPAGLRSVGWSDTGRGGVALVGDGKLYWFNRQLLPQGWLELSEAALTVALEAHGQYAAVTLVDCGVEIYDAHRDRVRRFSSSQPLTAVEFLLSRPALVGIAELGLLCCHTFEGDVEWRQPLWSQAGDLAVAGDGTAILLAGFSHGIQRYDTSGRQLGSYQLEGTVSRVATAYHPEFVAAATLERDLFWLRGDGQIEFRTALPDEVCRVICDPLAPGIIVGLAGGEIVRLDWPVARDAG